MCGINVIINANSDGQKAIEAMTNATIHRGPDHSGFSKVSENVFFAGNRLKILDLTDASNQPIWNDEKDAVLVWNGALYNYQDLRKELLDLGCSFSSNSDSEVLLKWLKTHGSKKLSALEGMFALVFADLIKNEIIIARDISGEKPLHYFQQDTIWYFSSESRGITAGLNFLPKIDPKQFIPFFYYRNSFTDKTFFEKVDQILPGEVLVLDFQGKVLDRKKLKIIPATHRILDQITFEETLKDAVLKSFHAERPVGMVLSGGADSSLLYAMWYEETGQAIPTYTVALEKKFRKKYADPHFADFFGKKYPSQHHEIFVDKKIILDNWNGYIQSLDQPIGDSAGFLTWYVAKEAKESVKVLVSGAGADELFGGYRRHKAFQHYLANPRLFHWMKSMGKNIPLPLAWQKLLQSIHQNPEMTFIQMAALQEIPDELMSHFQNWYPKTNHPFKNALDWDRTFYLVNDILKIHDNACMAHGIEGRAPYLNQQLLSLTAALSEKPLLELAGKKQIKTALKKRGLEKIANRKKLGFGLPLMEWFGEKDFRNWVFPAIHKMDKDWGKEFPPEMRKLSANPEKSDKRHFLQLWNLFILASWLENKQ
ncbi:asparagine synthase (glutamine-hydrolysing) [Aquiflexum balticum DSM 16537]|uniref:asparagine synthase (glutamine-hydrolyzing) n=1 Tax=Aquiflexum balticum DSM 16537 TaxID=758820 RepID=A0A1W2H0W1_9BACT|nr:asparagine synthase (glutamine-hydrolyzing) [Aquiflexum balticum]SMD42136.1 asparagine synthase (glutamine-hydrolysing) [Aquiflexum balticum DSM 16537]